MSNFEFQKVNSRVIRSGDNYLAKVDSAESFSSIFVDEEATYGFYIFHGRWFCALYRCCCMSVTRNVCF